MNFRFFFSEAIRTLKRNSAPSIAAFMTVMITTIVLGVFIPVTDATTGAANEIRGRLLVDVYIKDKATDSRVAQLKATILKIPNTKSIAYVSKEQAKKAAGASIDKQIELLGNNPLPASFRVTPKDPSNVDQII